MEPTSVGNIINALPPRLNRVDLKDSPQLVVLEGTTTIQNVAKLGADIDKLRGYLTQARIFPAKPAAVGLSTTISPGMRVISVPVSLTALQRRTIEPGDHVDVLFSYQAEMETFTGTAAEFVKVFAIDRQKMRDTETLETLSLLCTREQAAALQKAVTMATLQIALRGPIDKAADFPTTTLGDAAKQTRRDASTSIPAGMRLVSIPITTAGINRGMVRPGDHVDVIWTHHVETKTGWLLRTEIILESREVFAVDRERQADAGTSKPEPKVETVSLLCTPEQAVALQNAMAKGTLQISLRGPADKSTKSPTTASSEGPKPAGVDASPPIPAGMRLVSIPVAKYRLDRGTVLPGDRVDLIATIQLNPTPPEPMTGKGGKPQQIHDPMLMNAGLVLQDVEVFAIDRKRQGPTGPISETLTILCTTEQAQKLQSTLEKASVTISLRRGKNQAADASSPRPADKPKTDQSPASPVRAPTSMPGAPAVDSTPFRLYQGKTENDWQRVFLAETSPVAKLEAARALLSLAGELPPPKQIARILEIVGEISRVSFGGDPLEFAFEYHTKPATRGMRWPISNSKDVSQAFARFQIEVDDQVAQLPAESLVDGLSKSLQEGSVREAALAYAFLTEAAHARILETRGAAQQVLMQRLLKRLDGIPQDKDRAALVVLLRAQYLKHASPEQRRGVLASIEELAKQWRDGPETALHNRMKTELLYRQLKFSGCPECQKSFSGVTSRLILDQMQKQLLSAEFFELNDRYQRQHGEQFPYASQNRLSHRRQLGHFLNGWLPVANAYLAEHRDPPYDTTTREVVRTLNIVLPLYSEGDDWPIDKTAALLTEQLRAYYTADATKLTDQTPSDLLPMPPATLLTQIVRITGEIPDFVRKERPRSKSVARKLERFESYRANKVGFKIFKDDTEAWKDLMEEAPCEVVRRYASKLKPSEQVENVIGIHCGLEAFIFRSHLGGSVSS